MPLSEDLPVEWLSDDSCHLPSKIPRYDAGRASASARRTSTEAVLSAIAWRPSPETARGNELYGARSSATTSKEASRAPAGRAKNLARMSAAARLASPEAAVASAIVSGPSPETAYAIESYAARCLAETGRTSNKESRAPASSAVRVSAAAKPASPETFRSSAGRAATAARVSATAGRATTAHRTPASAREAAATTPHRSYNRAQSNRDLLRGHADQTQEFNCALLLLLTKNNELMEQQNNRMDDINKTLQQLVLSKNSEVPVRAQSPSSSEDLSNTSIRNHGGY